MPQRVYFIGSGVPYTQEEWANLVRSGVFRPKPPTWWVRAQNIEGRTGAAPYAIWHKNYDAERKIMIWLLSPDEDWRQAGYGR